MAQNNLPSDSKYIINLLINLNLNSVVADVHPRANRISTNNSKIYFKIICVVNF